MSAQQLAEVIEEGHWVKETNGEYLDAWNLFWGKDIVPETCPPHALWINALKPKARRTSSDSDNMLEYLVHSVLESTRSPIVLKPCSYIQTPWAEELCHTRGKIMLLEDYDRILNQLETNVQRKRDGAIIEGQLGMGKTYLAFYLLIQQLSLRRTVLFSPRATDYLLFLDTGVYRCGELHVDIDDSAFPYVVPRKAWIILDTPGEQAAPPYQATQTYFFPVQLCRPHSKYYHTWTTRGIVDMVAFGAPSPFAVLSGALIQSDVRSRKDVLLRLLLYLHDFGTHLRLCYRHLSKLDEERQSLAAYVNGFSDDLRARLARMPIGAHEYSDLLREEDGPDVLTLYRNVTSEKDTLIAVVASRRAMGELHKHFGFDDFFELRNMGAVAGPPDNLLDTRTWFFEHLCHSVISEGRATVNGRQICELSQRYPLDSEKTPGVLLLSHVVRSRNVHYYDDDPRAFDPAVYCVPRFLVDTALHAVTYVHPFSSRRRARPTNMSPQSGPITRQTAKRQAAAKAASAPETVRVTRSLKRSLDASVAELTEPPAKRPRLKSEKRSVIFFQMVLQVPPDLTESIPRMEHIMKLDPFAEYSMVFVTLKGEELDMSFVPVPWADRLQWYQLEIDLDFP